MDTSFITRGILIGGSLGALAVSFQMIEMSMFMGIGAGIVAGFLAGLTRTIINHLRNKK